MISRDSSQDETSVGNGYEYRLQETWESPSALVLFQVTWVGCTDIERAASRALAGRPEVAYTSCLRRRLHYRDVYE